jgi:broad specificity phosphatase PhoE
MRVYLVRHGQTQWNVEKRAQGHSDIALDATGVAQSARLAQVFNGQRSLQIFSSPLSRAAETARAIATSSGAPLHLVPELKERGFGDWEGLPFGEIGAKFTVAAAVQGVERNKVVPPRGESFVDVWDRICSVVSRVKTEGRDTILVSHGGTCSLILALLLDGGVGLSNAFKFHNASLSELESRHDGGFRLISYNDISHLEGLSVTSGSADGSSE